MNLVLRPDAVADVRAARDWYEDAKPGLGAQFLDELDRLLARLVEFPRSAPGVADYPDVRRALLRSFPFAAFYLLNEDEITVLRVLHTSRQPIDPRT